MHRRSNFPHPLTVLLVALAAALLPAAPSAAGVANRGLPGASKRNPLVARAMPWGRFHSPTRDPGVDPPSAYFNTARSRAVRRDIGRIVATPRFRWFGSWIPLHRRGHRATYKPGVYTTALRYIRSVRRSTHSRNALVPIGIFRLEPFERHIRDRMPTRREVRAYRAWITAFARAIRHSRARVVLLLQPDLPVAWDMPHHSKLDFRLIAWTARKFNALRYTTVYIDGGAADWQRPARTARMLRLAGIRHARGFALNVTHYESNAHSLAYGARVVRDLARHGVRRKHFVVATGMNGRPFSFHRVSRRYRRDPPVCRSAHARRCVALGAPPSTRTRHRAADAFLWLSRPWIDNATRRRRAELLRIIRHSPFFRRLRTLVRL